MENISLKDKIILLTGASKGIGYELSRLFADEGAKLILIGRKFSQPKVLGEHVYIEGDLTTKECIDSIRAVLDDYKVDILVNMAGIGIYKNLEDLTPEDFFLSLQLNTMVPFLLTKITMESLKKSDIGLVVNIGSGAGTMPFPGRSAYCTSKYALRGLSLSLSEEFRDQNISFMLITLGSTMTTFGGKSIAAQEEKIKNGNAIFPVEYAAREILNQIKNPEREDEFVLYPSEHGFGAWKKPSN